MLPNNYTCSSCHEKFEFEFRQARYYLGAAPLGKQVAFGDLLQVNVRPVWCKDCECVCVVEDIASLRVFEDAYGAARNGRPLEYPVYSDYMEAAEVVKSVGDHLRWRMGRRHPARALCCGGSRYQLMDVAQPILKHAQCEFGFIESGYHIGPYCGPGPGVYSPANIRVYDGEGVLIGQLTWYKREEDMWDTEPLKYPPPVADD
ncbi:MAG TPA: hypothetical protein VF800_29575 [Telluria sp.]|jgi:hypothetical protein